MTMTPCKAFRLELDTLPGGKIEFALPLPAGSRVEVVVIARAADEFQGLRDAAALTMDFWDNPEDDAEWNNA
jgi:hypothetical protein